MHQSKMRLMRDSPVFLAKVRSYLFVTDSHYDVTLPLNLPFFRL